MNVISEWEIVVRHLLSSVLSDLISLERESYRLLTGLRTQMG